MSRLLRILCLHGNDQDIGFMNQFKESWSTDFKHKVEFVCISGSLPDKRVPESSSANFKQDASHKVEINETTYDIERYLESLYLVKEFVKKKGPFDGIIGFSEGAILAGLLLHLQQFNSPFTYLINYPKFQFGILVRGNLPQSTVFRKFFHTVIKVPTLHIIDQYNPIIKPENSRKLAEYFYQPKLVHHSVRHELSYQDISESLQLFIDPILYSKAKQSLHSIVAKL